MEFMRQLLIETEKINSEVVALVEISLYNLLLTNRNLAKIDGIYIKLDWEIIQVALHIKFKCERGRIALSITFIINWELTFLARSEIFSTNHSKKFVHKAGYIESRWSSLLTYIQREEKISLRYTHFQLFL